MTWSPVCEHYLFIYLLDLYCAFLLKSWFKILHMVCFEREIYKICLGLEVDNLTQHVPSTWCMQKSLTATLNG